MIGKNNAPWMDFEDLKLYLRDKNILLATQENGGANQLLSYLDTVVCDSRIWRMFPSNNSKMNPRYSEISKSDILVSLQSFDLIIVAASVDNRESQTQFLSHLVEGCNIPLFVFLDSWLNFKERLENVKSSALLVSDKFAYNYAKEIANENDHVLMVEDCEFSLLKKSYHPSLPNSNILLLETRRDNFSVGAIHLHGPECFCFYAESLLKKFTNQKLIYRRHPSISINSCHIYLDKNPSIEISNNHLLVDDLNRCNSVFGKPSRALYLADNLGLATMRLCDVNKNWHGPQFNRVHL
jgi:hypothetical protein